MNYYKNRFILKRYDRIFVTSKFLKKRLDIYGKYNHDIISFGINQYSNQKKINKKNKITLGIVKRLEDVAGIDRFIKIVKVLNDQNKNINALIIGSGSRMKDLKKLTKKLSLDHIIKFKGQIPEEDVLDYYNKIDIAVFPSRVESFGVSQLEAMSMGVPVVASDVGGVNELIKNGYNGILIKKFSIEEFTNQINKLIRYPLNSLKIANAAKEFSRKNFRMNILTSKLVGHYEELIK